MDYVRGGLAIAVIGVALIGSALFLVETGEAVYYVEAVPTDEPRENATAEPLHTLDDPLRDAVRESIARGSSVEVGSERPDYPEYVRHEGHVYGLGTLVGDPGGGGAVMRLYVIGVGLLSILAGGIVTAVAYWRR